MFHDLPDSFYELLESQDGVILLESSKSDQDNFTSLLFFDPIEILEIFSVDQVPGLFARIEQLLGEGYHVAGYFTYELGFHFEDIADLPPGETSLAWFGAYRRPLVFDHRTGETGLIHHENVAAGPRRLSSTEEPRISGLRLAIDSEEYEKAIEKIKCHIRSGNTYQINFTTAYNFRLEGSPLALYRDLKEQQRVPYGAYLRTGERAILCCSPELFFRRRGNSIVTKPMKGTVRRGVTNEEDDLLTRWLRNDAKNRSENIMIVDLLRNDVGRISEPGTVRASELFSVEAFESLLQMSSTIEGTLQSGIRYVDIFRSLFPCGSVTGAPKIRSMQIISELESRQRGIYTGAIGYFSPNDEATFNVAIRTVTVHGSAAEMGVGGGIVHDSSAQEEFAECKLKAHFLTQPREEFRLIESLLWDDRYPFIAEHLERVQDSARYFRFACDGAELTRELAAYARQFANGKSYKVRLTVNRTGKATIEHSILEEQGRAQLRVMIAGVRTDSRDRFLYHKTTHRHLYDEVHKQALANGCADAIFLNERGEITEGAISHVFIKRQHQLITPPLSSGLLNGVYRRHVLRSHSGACEQVLYPHDLATAEALYVCNAVRGMREVRLCASGDLSEVRST